MGATASVAVSSFGNAYITSEQGRAQKAVSRYNASIARMQADDALERGRFAERQYRRDVSRAIGSQRSGFAAQNVDVDAGTAAYIQSDAKRISELDALMIRNNAAKEAMGYRMGAEIEAGRGAAASRMARAQAALTLSTGGSEAYGVYRKQNPK